MAAVRARFLALCHTHITIDEISQIPEAKQQRRREMLSWLDSTSSLIPTGDFVVGESRVGLARIGAANGLFDAMRTSNTKNTRDAAIAATAAVENAYRLTYDKALARRAQQQGIAVGNWAELLEFVGSDLDHRCRANS